MIEIRALTPRAAGVLWRRLLAVRHALGADVVITVTGPDGQPLEGFTDSPAERARCIQLWAQAQASASSAEP